MPKDLRTPLEALALVDTFRQALGAVVRAAAEIGSGDLGAFAEALIDGDGNRTVPDGACLLGPQFATLADIAPRMLHSLGAYAGEQGELRFRPFGIETAAGASDTMEHDPG